MDEITQEENDLMLLQIKIHEGLCPICKENIIHRFDWEWGIEFNTQKRVYSCCKCGFIAKEIHKW
jgi:hypothetical protein